MQSLGDVLGGQVRIRRRDLGGFSLAGYPFQDHRHADARPFDARRSPENGRIGCDVVEGHLVISG